MRKIHDIWPFPWKWSIWQTPSQERTNQNVQTYISTTLHIITGFMALLCLLTDQRFLYQECLNCAQLLPTLYSRDIQRFPWTFKRFLKNFCTLPVPIPSCTFLKVMQWLALLACSLQNWEKCTIININSFYYFLLISTSLHIIENVSVKATTAQIFQQQVRLVVDCRNNKDAVVMYLFDIAFDQEYFWIFLNFTLCSWCLKVGMMVYSVQSNQDCSQVPWSWFMQSGMARLLIRSWLLVSENHMVWTILSDSNE